MSWSWIHSSRSPCFERRVDFKPPDRTALGASWPWSHRHQPHLHPQWKSIGLFHHTFALPKPVSHGVSELAPLALSWPYSTPEFFELGFVVESPLLGAQLWLAPPSRRYSSGWTRASSFSVAFDRLGGSSGRKHSWWCSWCTSKLRKLFQRKYRLSSSATHPPLGQLCRYLLFPSTSHS